MNLAFTVWSSMTGQGYSHTPSTYSSRLVFVTCYIFGLVLVTSYSAKLTSNMAVSKLPFTNPDELLDPGNTNYKIILYQWTTCSQRIIPRCKTWSL